MSDAPPEVMVRVQAVSDPKAFKRHLLRMFEQGQPRYADFYDADAEPWTFRPEMVPDFVEEWQPIGTGVTGRERLIMALALTFSMPADTDPTVNEAAALAVARSEFAGRERVWVAGDSSGPFVKLLVKYRDEEDRPLSSGPADLRRYRESYVRELGARGVVAQATTRDSRSLSFGGTREAYKIRQRLVGANQA